MGVDAGRKEVDELEAAVELGSNGFLLVDRCPLKWEMMLVECRCWICQIREGEAAMNGSVAGRISMGLVATAVVGRTMDG
ncbi:hypothetical protein ACLOJK_041007 [Asimina triloba]